MYLALGVVLLAVATLSLLTSVRVRGPSADEVRGFALVAAAGAVVVTGTVLGVGLLWDARIADAIAIIALFALVVYYLAALVVGARPRRPPKPPRSPKAG